MALYKPTAVPYGIADPTKRTIRNDKIRDEAYFTKYGIETGGTHFECRVVVAGGGGVPIHSHASYGEQFFPEHGTLGVVGHNGTKTMLLNVGDTYRVKPGEWHRFFNPSPTETIIFNVKVAPAHVGFERTLHIVYGLCQDGLASDDGLPKNPYYTLLTMYLGQVDYPGIGMWFVGKLAKVVGWHAEWSGELDRLTEKYYGRKVTDADRAKYKVA